MEWTIQDLGAVGEFVGAIAVVITLIYLATEVRLAKRSFDANTHLLQRQHELQVAEASKLVAESVAGQLRPMIQDATLAKVWLDGLSGVPLDDVDEFRFNAMAHEQIWQEATMHARLLVLDRPEIADAGVAAFFALQIRANPGYRRCWEANVTGLRMWGYEALVDAVDRKLQQSRADTA